MCVLCCPALFISFISCLNSFRVLINFLHFIVPFIIVYPPQNISYKCHECRDLDCLVHSCIPSAQHNGTGMMTDLRKHV